MPAPCALHDGLSVLHQKHVCRPPLSPRAPMQLASAHVASPPRCHGWHAPAQPTRTFHAWHGRHVLHSWSCVGICMIVGMLHWSLTSIWHASLPFRIVGMLHSSTCVSPPVGMFGIFTLHIHWARPHVLRCWHLLAWHGCRPSCLACAFGISCCCLSVRLLAPVSPHVAAFARPHGHGVGMWPLFPACVDARLSWSSCARFHASLAVDSSHPPPL